MRRSDETIVALRESYNRLADALAKVIEERDRLAAKISLMPPEKQLAARDYLATMNSRVEETERQTADAYENLLEETRLHEEADERMAKTIANSAKLFVYVKHKNPANVGEYLDGLTNVILPEEEREFYAQVALLEVTRLKETLAEVETSGEEMFGEDEEQ